MRKWTIRLGGLLLIALFVVAVLYDCSTHVVRGWLRGEAFYDGRPTSWWRGELSLWEVRRTRMPVPLRGVEGQIHQLLDLIPEKRYQDHFTYTRAARWTDKYREYWLSSNAIMEARVVEIGNMMNGPSVLSGGEDAEPVLRQLLDNESEHVRRFARIGLKMDSLIPVETD